MRTFSLSEAKGNKNNLNTRTLITALATPFLNGKIDVNGYVKLCKLQQENGVSALLALGTTAEAQLLSKCERKLLLTLAKTSTNLPLIAGIEEPSTAQACRDAEQYAIIGANALMVAPPPFCKCTASGYVKHVEAIALASKLPVILYNIPSRAGYALETKSVRQLVKKGYVQYIKDSSNSVSFAKNIADCCNVLCGADERLKKYLEIGACGAVSVASNVAPKLTRQALLGEDCGEFSRLAYLAMREINPIAVKYMLYKAGIFESYEVRLPLTKANVTTRKLIDAEWENIANRELTL